MSARALETGQAPPPADPMRIQECGPWDLWHAKRVPRTARIAAGAQGRARLGVRLFGCVAACRGQ
jgi:hypothetical protein